MSTEEAALVQDFISRVSSSTIPVTEELARRFLIAKKFNLDAAVSQFTNYCQLQASEGLCLVEPTDASIQQELLSGKFTILKPDQFNCAIGVFSGRLHNPTITSSTLALKAAIFQMDMVLRSRVVQENGLIIIYDMANSNFRNFDYKFSMKLLNILKNAYPARLKRVFIFQPPTWFLAIYRPLSLILRQKIRERVSLIFDKSELLTHVPAECLPSSLGGRVQHDHVHWINNCTTTFLQDKAKPRSDNYIDDSRRADERSNSTATSIPASFPPNPSNVQSGTDADVQDLPEHSSPTTLNIADMRQYVQMRGQVGLGNEYNEICTETSNFGSFDTCHRRENIYKNRYSNVPCFDHSRVTLLREGTDGSDYIHANFADSYRQPKAFICAQGPMEDTARDFWQMIWEQEVTLIVMLTKTVERGQEKCGQYWCPNTQSVFNCEGFKVHTVSLEKFDSHISYRLNLFEEQSGESREILHFHYVGWPDFGVPESPDDFMAFLAKVQRLRDASVGRSPVVVHCSAGIGRTGTFVMLDALTRQLRHRRTADVPRTLRLLRSQRALSVNSPDQYLFCYLALLKYAAATPF